MVQLKTLQTKLVELKGQADKPKKGGGPSK